MTRKNYLKSTKIKFLLTLVLACLLSFTLLFATACNNSTSKIPEYSYSEEDDGLLKNASFAYGTTGIKLENYPRTSLTGWSLSKESSTSKSGVIDVTEDGWKALMSNLYSDSGILNYVKEVKDFTNNDVIDAIKEQKQDDKAPTSEEIKNYILDNYFLGNNKAFSNPGTHANDLDTKVYMLNNYKNGEIGYGAIQHLASSTDIILNKGEYAKVSIWIKTENLNTDTTNAVYGKDIGANVKLFTYYNGQAQASFGIYNITDTDWTEYTFYVKADEVYETKFNLAVGLGYEDDRKYAVEGTVYFDDITVELVTAEEYANANLTVTEFSLEYASEDAYFVEATSLTNVPLYDMSLNVYDLSGYVNDLTTSAFVDSFYTKSNSEGITGKYSADSFGKVETVTLSNENIPYGINKALKVDVNTASYTIKLDSPDFVLASENYAYVSFFIKNNLSEFYATDITVDVFDVKGSTTEKRPALATFNEVSKDWVQCNLLIRNNFDRETFTDNRSFYIEIVIGPAIVTSQNAIDYATGTVYLTAPILTKGATYKYASDADETNDIKTANYDYYLLLTSEINGSTALYAEHTSDYAADENDSNAYSLTVSPSDMGTIFNKPATPKNYNGITFDHYYIDPDSTKYAVNTNETAGLINSKYLANYTSLPGVASALNYTGTDDVQPMVIYNPTADCYGYIGTNNLIAKSAYAKVSVKVRVVGSATAYVYLVNTAQPIKSVMTFDDFTVNTDGLNSITGTSVVGAEKQLFFKVTEDMMEDDGWLTVEFYIATGASEKNFRVEVWNGDRTGTLKSSGYVFFNDITVTSSGAFTEVSRWQDAFSKTGNPLYNETFEDGNLFLYKQELTDTEKAYNNDPSKTNKVSYSPSYVWAQNDSLIYAIYKTIDPVEVNPYDNDTEETPTTPDNTTEVNPSTFWLSISSILLGVALALAIITLVVKNFIRKKKANASDAKSHFKVTSRVKQTSKSKSEKRKVEKTAPVEDEVEEVETETADAADDIEETEKVEETTETESEQTLDEYVYGEVQSFGDDEEK